MNTAPLPEAKSAAGFQAESAAEPEVGLESGLESRLEKELETRFGAERPEGSLALVADDDPSNRMLLAAMLAQCGYAAVEAENGVQAFELFRTCRPDIVFMDVLMPVMDGLEATRLIKLHSGGDFIPVLFITALEDEDILRICVESGGDDFIRKPFSPGVLQSKITSMARIRDLYRELQGLHSRMQRDEEIAEQVFRRAVLSGNVFVEGMRTLLQPASTFNGDVMLSAFRPNGEVNLVLGDFTGHGLAASIGALPVSEIFRTMTAKGYSLQEILHETNSKLCRLLPTGMFLSACFVTIANDGKRVSIWNGGMPDVLVLGGDHCDIRRRIPSTHPPLGICGHSQEEFLPEVIETSVGERILLASDGVLEARNAEGELFGDRRYLLAVREGMQHLSVFARVVEWLQDFCGDAPQDDDISLVEMPCQLPLLPLDERATRRSAAEVLPLGGGGWRWALRLEGQALKRVDPIPLVMSQLQELIGGTEDRQALFCVLTELYLNALDHGVLGLDSSLKHSSEGFVRFFAEREQRLAELAKGYVVLELDFYTRGSGAHLCLRVRDSGSGFDYRRRLDPVSQAGALSGRGIQLVRGLCDSLVYTAPGNRVEAVLTWS